MTTITFSSLHDGTEEAEQYGVKGQRWGIRRATTRGGTPPSKRKPVDTVDLVDNKSGKRTSIRFNPKRTQITRDAEGNVVGLKSKSRKDNKAIQKQIDDAAEAHRKEAAKSLTTAELRDRNERLRLAQEYAKMTTQKKAENVVSEVLKSVAKKSVSRALETVATDILTRSLGMAAKKTLPKIYVNTNSIAKAAEEAAKAAKG